MLDQLRKLDSEVVLRHRSLLKGLVIHVRHLQVLNTVFLVEVLEGGVTEHHVMINFDQFEALTDRKATPLL